MPLTLAPVNVERLAREVIGELQAAHPNRRFRFELLGDLTFSCDGARLRQVISNLLGNAIEHGSEESGVELKIASEGSDIVLAVRMKALVSLQSYCRPFSIPWSETCPQRRNCAVESAASVLAIYRPRDRDRTWRHNRRAVIRRIRHCLQRPLSA
jgi:hypothetical protein